MSKAFVKDDAEEAPVSFQPIDLAPEVENHMTSAGYENLKAELEKLSESNASQASAARIAYLRGRIESANVIDPSAQESDRVLFGAKVTVVDEEERTRNYQIVGLDETDVKQGRVSWISPVAKALLQKQVGDVATLKTPQGEEDLEIVKIEFS